MVARKTRGRLPADASECRNVIETGRRGHVPGDEANERIPAERVLRRSSNSSRLDPARDTASLPRIETRLAGSRS